MATTQQNSSSPTPVWIWTRVPIAGELNSAFHHPSDMPSDKETADMRWVKNLRGPRAAKIRQAVLLQLKGNLALVKEDEVTREVPKSLIVPWYEGLLLLQEMTTTAGQAGHLQASWSSKELINVLNQQRAKFKSLSGWLYAQRRLVHTAITGAAFFDTHDLQWSYRRENVKGDDKTLIGDAEDAVGFSLFKEIVTYLPPWEAFFHDRCGFYQDFYQVRWEHPYSEVNYSKVENGHATEMGCTWEPDECLPAHLDALRIQAKNKWIQQQMKETENKIVESVHRKPSKRARVDQGGKPLALDLFRPKEGHDFKTTISNDQLAGIRNGWPKVEADYPPGFGVANPPGFCFENCDCMDDARPQRSWETHKAWLESQDRTEQAKACIQLFEKQSIFVRRRGTVSNCHYFEPIKEKEQDLSVGRGALDLAGSISRRVAEVLTHIPLQSLQGTGVPVSVPAVVFLKETIDAEPLRFTGTLKNGAPLPSSIRLDPFNGELTATELSLTEDCGLIITLHMSEGSECTANLNITPRRPHGTAAMWSVGTGAIISRFENLGNLDRSTREVLQDRLGDIYDFNSKIVREISLGHWLKCTSLVIRMLRSCSVAHITASQVRSGPVHLPVTPP